VTDKRSVEEIERAIRLVRADLFQQNWDQMFMLDVYPENAPRLGMDMRALAKLVDDARTAGAI
jgi:hypothetical protein